MRQRSNYLVSFHIFLFNSLIYLLVMRETMFSFQALCVFTVSSHFCVLSKPNNFAKTPTDTFIPPPACGSWTQSQCSFNAPQSADGRPRSPIQLTCYVLFKLKLSVMAEMMLWQFVGTRFGESEVFYGLPASHRLAVNVLFWGRGVFGKYKPYAVLNPNLIGLLN